MDISLLTDDEIRHLPYRLKKPDPLLTRVGLFVDLDQFRLAGRAQHSAMAGIDWVQVIGIATLVLSTALLLFVVFTF
jgi:hypothetical protein